jgi:hypothetical protein
MCGIVVATLIWFGGLQMIFFADPKIAKSRSIICN